MRFRVDRPPPARVLPGRACPLRGVFEGARMGGRWAVLAVWATASGCVVSVGDKPAPPPVPATADVAPASGFAAERLPPPGGFRPDHPQLAAAEPPPPRPADPPPVVVPSLKPPPEYVAASFAPPDSPAVAAVRHLEAGRPQDAEVALAALPAGAGGTVLPLLVAAVQAAGAKGGPAGVAEVVRTLDAAAAGLAAQAPLEVTRAALCGDVKGFARYDPLPDRPVLRAGKRDTVWMYLELRNVVAQPQGDRFVVRLNLSLLVRDAAGAVVDQYAEPPEMVPLRGPRRDNSAALWFRAPERPGSYTVTMRVTEPAADNRGVSREASRTLAFTVK